MKASELINRPVVSLTDGAKVGNVSDLMLDATHVKVQSLVMAGHAGNSVVPFAAVRHVGTDAVTIDDARTVQAPAADSEITERRTSTLTGLPVLTQNGTIVGNLEDVEFDATSGQLIALQVHRGGMLGIGGSREDIPASAIKGLGGNLITVEMATPTPTGTQEH